MAHQEFNDGDDDQKVVIVEPSGSAETGTASSSARDAAAAAVARRLAEERLRCVCFDMDQTLVRAHSRGRLRRGPEFEAYAAAVSLDALALARACRERGLALAVCTHSDVAEYSAERHILPETHLLGTDLVSQLLGEVLPDLREEIFVVAYNPHARGDADNAAKNLHIRRVVEHYDLAGPWEALLFDDDRGVVAGTEGCRMVQVDAERGFLFEDLPPDLAASKFD